MIRSWTGYALKAGRTGFSVASQQVDYGSRLGGSSQRFSLSRYSSSPTDPPSTISYSSGKWNRNLQHSNSQNQHSRKSWLLNQNHAHRSQLLHLNQRRKRRFADAYSSRRLCKMPDCIYRFNTANKSICLIAPAHVGPCLAKACCLALTNHLSPQFKPAMKGRLKFWIQAKDWANLFGESRTDWMKQSESGSIIVSASKVSPNIEILKCYPHLDTFLVRAAEEDIVKLALERGSSLEHISKAIPFRVVGQT